MPGGRRAWDGSWDFSVFRHCSLGPRDNRAEGVPWVTQRYPSGVGWLNPFSTSALSRNSIVTRGEGVATQSVAATRSRKTFDCERKDWSGREDLNLRPPGPEMENI